MLKNILKITVIFLAAFSLISSCKDKPKGQYPAEREVNSQAASIETMQKETGKITSQQIQTTNTNNKKAQVLQDSNSAKPSEVAGQEPNKTNAGKNQDAADSNSNEPNISNTAVSKSAEPNQPNSLKEKISFNSRFSGIFSEFADEQGYVNYKKLKNKRNDLSKALDDIAKLDPNEYKSWPKEEQIALWINAYNLRMLNIIIDNYPIESNRFMRMIPGWEIDSIRHIDKSIGGIEKQKIIVMDEEFTLAGIEEEIFSKRFNEPRCYLAISHLGLSGPTLRNEAYIGSKLNEQFTEQIKKYLTNSRVFKIDVEKKMVYLPAILDKGWHGKYFTEKYRTGTKFKDQDESTAALLNFLINYLPAPDVSFLELQNYTVTFFGYNWRLMGR